jgi:MFS family permease
MLPLRLFRIRSVAVASSMLLLFGGIGIGMWYFTSLLMQDALGYSALESGLGQTPAAVLFVVVARFAAGWLPRLGARKLLLIGCAFLAAGFAWLSQAGADSTYLADLLGPTVLIAFGIGFTFPTLMAAATVDAPRGEVGIVGGIASTASQVGAAVWLAVLATAATARGKAEHPGLSGSALQLGYDAVFWIAAGLAAAIALLTVLLPARHQD